MRTVMCLEENLREIQLEQITVLGWAHLALPEQTEVQRSEQPVQLQVREWEHLPKGLKVLQQGHLDQQHVQVQRRQVQVHLEVHGHLLHLRLIAALLPEVRVRLTRLHVAPVVPCPVEAAHPEAPVVPCLAEAVLPEAQEVAHLRVVVPDRAVAELGKKDLYNNSQYNYLYWLFFYQNLQI